MRINESYLRYSSDPSSDEFKNLSWMIDDLWSSIEARLEAMMSLQHVSATKVTKASYPQPKIPNSSSSMPFQKWHRR